MNSNSILQKVQNLLQSSNESNAALESVLDFALVHFQCTVGTIHQLELQTQILHLRAYRGIPESIMNKVSRVPVGKGMAGIAAERRKPVQVCNLQTDSSGVVRPGAKETKMEGAAAVPIFVGEDLRGVLGVAKSTPYDFPENEMNLLLQIGTIIGQHWATPSRLTVLDHYFIEARSRLIDLAAFLDRVERASGEEDFRMVAIRKAIRELDQTGTERTKKVLLSLSDPTTEPIDSATTKSATGAWPGTS